MEATTKRTVNAGHPSGYFLTETSDLLTTVADRILPGREEVPVSIRLPFSTSIVYQAAIRAASRKASLEVVDLVAASMLRAEIRGILRLGSKSPQKPSRFNFFDISSRELVVERSGDLISIIAYFGLSPFVIFEKATTIPFAQLGDVGKVLRRAARPTGMASSGHLPGDVIIGNGASQASLREIIRDSLGRRAREVTDLDVLHHDRHHRNSLNPWLGNNLYVELQSGGMRHLASVGDHLPIRAKLLPNWSGSGGFIRIWEGFDGTRMPMTLLASLPAAPLLASKGRRPREHWNLLISCRNGVVTVVVQDRHSGARTEGTVTVNRDGRLRSIKCPDQSCRHTDVVPSSCPALTDRSAVYF